MDKRTLEQLEAALSVLRLEARANTADFHKRRRSYPIRLTTSSEGNIVVRTRLPTCASVAFAA
jgi:hypothetical protein